MRSGTFFVAHEHDFLICDMFWFSMPATIANRFFQRKNNMESPVCQPRCAAAGEAPGGLTLNMDWKEPMSSSAADRQAQVRGLAGRLGIKRGFVLGFFGGCDWVLTQFWMSLMEFVFSCFFFFVFRLCLRCL